jgi:hypothetical protein
VTAARSLVGLLCAALVGCAGETSAPPGPIEGEDEIAAAWCETLVRCDVYPDLEACLAAIDVVGDDLRAAFEAGHVEYDAAGATGCQAALAQLACEELTGAPDLAGCDVWTGTVPDGGECTNGAECESGRCDPGECDPALSCCTGACASEEVEEGVADGGDCTFEPCVPESYCDLGAEPATCRPLVAVDQPCTEGQCQVDLYCRITDAALGTGACSALPGEGQPCDPEVPICARADNWCDPVDNTCRKLAAVGEACDELADNCVPYAWCAPDGLCVALPGEGEPCEDWPPCLGDLECVDDTCVIPPPEEDCAEG